MWQKIVEPVRKYIFYGNEKVIQDEKMVKEDKKEEHNFMGESCFIWRIDCCRNMETGKSERNLEKSFIKGRMPGNHFRSSRHVL